MEEDGPTCRLTLADHFRLRIFEGDARRTAELHYRCGNVVSSSREHKYDPRGHAEFDYSDESVGCGFRPTNIRTTGRLFQLGVKSLQVLRDVHQLRHISGLDLLRRL